ncbi:protein tramtrack, beta isoform-like isoform X3 [Diorhabda carinulata]|uniref:protein tramtrack, beta isoform-like isoform X3 n=1 Tax=Diorhabda carinulata TaxID=1163345 RepID=UPI0025A256B8|nr:protein tramtrack, beta isoform-like isoform X3 [Diorhabda carinulata]
MASEQFSLCWDNFHKNMSSGMNSLLENEDLVDVTLAVQGKCLKAHKMVLSVCSPYFKELFKSNPCQHPIVFMKDVSYEALSDLLQFMYQGEVQVSQENLSTFIKTAEALQIKGLTGDGNGSTDNDVTEVPVEKHTPHVEEYKPIPVSRPKKQQLSSAPPTSSPSVKRQRLSSNDAQSIPQTITKVEPVAPSHQSINVSTPEPAAVHFKMEPYDQSQNLLDETGDENFGDDTLDENVGDDTEDYSMMETGTGGPEEEPQAGTSTDGAGEGQDSIEKMDKKLPRKKRISSRTRFVYQGFVYHNNIVAGNPPLRYLGCAEHKKSGCRGRATIPVDGWINELKITKPHNHPPDLNAEEKEDFLKELKCAIRSDSMANSTMKKVYEIVASAFPKAAADVPFKSISSSLHRWRRNPLM